MNLTDAKKKGGRVYDASDSPTLQHFMTDFNTPFCGVMSHVNSGKTSAMCVKSQWAARNQHPDVNGVRYSAHMFIRGTAGDLLRSTVRTFQQWLPSQLMEIRRSTPIGGHLKMKPLNDQNTHFPTHMFREGKAFPYMIGCSWNPKTEEYEGGTDVSGMRIGDIFPQGTFVDAMFDFVPLDNPDWEAILLGYEATIAYFDEPDSMTNIEDVLTKLPGRLGRMPPADVAPLTCSQVNMAFNPPPEGSFTQEFFDIPNAEELGRKLYRVQPPLLMEQDIKEPNNFFKAKFTRNPNAEGVRFAAKGFKHWEDIVDANRHDPNKIRRDVLGTWTKGSGGDLIHPEFNRDVHMDESVKANKALKIFCSCDWGNAGAMLICQVVNGGVQVIEEMSAKDIMAHEFVIHHVIPHLNSEYRGYDIIVTGDPSGRYKRDVGEGPFTIFEDAGFLVEDDTPMDPEQRWSAVNHALKYQDGLKIHPECRMLIQGFEGQYTFKNQVKGSERKQADKRKHHSAYQDCLQAVCCLVFAGYETAASTILGMDRYNRVEDEDEENEMLWV